MVLLHLGLGIKSNNLWNFLAALFLKVSLCTWTLLYIRNLLYLLSHWNFLHNLDFCKNMHLLYMFDLVDECFLFRQKFDLFLNFPLNLLYCSSYSYFYWLNYLFHNMPQQILQVNYCFPTMHYFQNHIYQKHSFHKQSNSKVVYILLLLSFDYLKFDYRIYYIYY